MSEFTERSLFSTSQKQRISIYPKSPLGGSLWSPSYFAGSCGGAPISIIRQYIENQQSPQE